MPEHIEVDDFLAHYGIPGMKWGKRNARRDVPKSSSKGSEGADSALAKPKMSRKKKIAIGIGVGAVVAIGAAVVLSSMNKNMDLPIKSLVDKDSTKKGAKAHEERMAEAMNRIRLEKDSPLKTLNDLNAYREKAVKDHKDSVPLKTLNDLNAYREKAVKDAGLTLAPRSTNTPTESSNILGNRLKRAGLTIEDLNPNRGTMPRSHAPDLNTLSNLINGGPQVVFNPKNGRYETR